MVKITVIKKGTVSDIIKMICMENPQVHSIFRGISNEGGVLSDRARLTIDSLSIDGDWTKLNSAYTLIENHFAAPVSIICYGDVGDYNLELDEVSAA